MLQRVDPYCVSEPTLPLGALCALATGVGLVVVGLLLYDWWWKKRK